MTPEEASRQFYAQIWPLRAVVLRTARFLCGNAAEADDLAQEALLKAFRAMESLVANSSPQRWLMTILRNTYIDRLRGGKHEAGQVSFEDVAMSLASPRGDRSAEADVHDSVALLEQFSDAQMIAELQQLPEEIRWTLLLVDVEQMPYEDAADILGVPAGTAKSRVHRGRAMLRDRMLASGHIKMTPDAPGAKAGWRVK